MIEHWIPGLLESIVIVFLVPLLLFGGRFTLPVRVGFDRLCLIHLEMKEPEKERALVEPDR